MSKNNNVNPGQYKVAGRERQGEDIVHSTQKRAQTIKARELEHREREGRNQKQRSAGK